MGVPESRTCVSAFPAWAPEGLAVQYFDWIVRELKSRDDGTWAIHYRPGLDGSFLFGLEDVTEYGGGER